PIQQMRILAERRARDSDAERHRYATFAAPVGLARQRVDRAAVGDQTRLHRRAGRAEHVGVYVERRLDVSQRRNTPREEFVTRPARLFERRFTPEVQW